MTHRERSGVTAVIHSARRGGKIGATLVLVFMASLAIGATAARAAAPEVTAGPSAESVRYTTAHLTATLDPKDHETSYHFEWVSQAQFEAEGFTAAETNFQMTGFGSYPENAGPLPIEADLGGLAPSTTYHLRLVAENTEGERIEPEATSTFETEAVEKPAVTIDPAGTPTASTVQLSGSVDPNAPEPEGSTDSAEQEAFRSSWRFECTPSCEAPSGAAVEAGDTAQPVAAEATGLQPHTEYHVKLIAENAGGSSETTEVAFTTEPAAPVLGHTFVGEVGESAATLHTEVDPGGASTTVHFEYLSAADFEAGGFTSATSTSESASLGEDNTQHPTEARIEGLDPGTRYAYRAVATNSVESVPGEAHFFRTDATPVEETDSCANAARRSEQHASFLPDCRAYEMVSPPGKNGGQIVGMSSRTHAAAGESPGLPAAVAFSSLQGFGDVKGTGIATEYMAQRDGAPGSQGWSTHGITPAQKPTTLLELLGGQEPRYTGEMSADLIKGVFQASTPLTDAPNVAHVPNLYLRDDLRTPGAGSYQLLSDASSPLPAPVFGQDVRELVTGISDDFQHVLFESHQNLTPDSSGSNPKLYKSDEGVVRLISAEPACPGALFAAAKAPCSVAGQGQLTLHYTLRTLSSDGSRVNFTSPTTSNGNFLETTGAASKLFQLDDRGSATTSDDAIVQINASEASNPGPTRAASFSTASVDGNRVFFVSGEELLDGAHGGLYMWERQDENEVQRVSVDATGGTFTLTAHGQPSHGLGTLSEGSSTVEGVEGSFEVGQVISAPGIPPGTTIAEIPSSQKLILSEPASANEETAQLSASSDATTAPLPFDASAQQVQEALEGLDNLGEGNVSVSGSPGGTAPYSVSFTGGLAGVDVLPLSADPSDLSGGASTATVTVTTPVRNLTLIAATSLDAGALGASTDGHRLYFGTVGGQLVSGGPPTVNGAGIYYWQDAGGSPGGTLSFVGGVAPGDLASNTGYALWNSAPKTTRVTPDGRELIFEVSDGSELAPGYDHSHSQCLASSSGTPNNTGFCSEAYVYRADTSSPTVPDLVCASCDPSGAPPTASAWLDLSKGASATAYTTHLSHALSDDGRYVFFSTPDSLVLEDTNGAFDAYQYDTVTEQPQLLSGGTDASDSYFLDASADGHDVYFVTRQPLVGWDTDNAYDMYDARVEGGFPEPPPAPPVCGGETCRSAAPGAPAPGPIGSAGKGTGNPTSRCPHGRRAVKRHGKTRCVKRRHHRRRHSRHNHNRTSNHRRAGR